MEYYVTLGESFIGSFVSLLVRSLVRSFACLLDERNNVVTASMDTVDDFLLHQVDTVVLEKVVRVVHLGYIPSLAIDIRRVVENGIKCAFPRGLEIGFSSPGKMGNAIEVNKHVLVE
jgi:hypothetical protein